MAKRKPDILYVWYGNEGDCSPSSATFTKPKSVDMYPVRGQPFGWKVFVEAVPKKRKAVRRGKK